MVNEEQIQKAATWTHAHTRTVLATIFGTLILAGLFISQARDKGRELSDLRSFIEQKDADRARDQAEIKAELARVSQENAQVQQQKQLVLSQPSAAPQVIKEYIPLTSPIQQTAPITSSTLPDAPVAQLTLKQEQELATFGATCRQCQNDLSAKNDVIAEKDREIKAVSSERDKAVQAAKGGSVWHRVSRTLLTAGCSGAGAGAGAAAGSRSGVPAKGAAIGAALGALGCSLFH